MRQLKESNINLPDFVEMTNHCEEKGYEVKIISVYGGYLCKLYKDNNFVKSSQKIYEKCIDAQIESYTKLYKFIEQC